MEITEVNIKKMAQYCFENVFRTTTDKPGFVYLDFGTDLNSTLLRSIMVDLKKELSKYTNKHFSKRLSYHWLVRFDQQVNTPFHIDNAGEESFLMLGYEPSEVECELYLADYFKYAKNSGEAPKNFLEAFTPVFKENEALLTPYITKLSPFLEYTYKIVLINNSNPVLRNDTFGVFHKAKIVEPNLQKSRIVNSALINMSSNNEAEENETSEQDFIKTEVISK